MDKPRIHVSRRMGNWGEEGASTIVFGNRNLEIQRETQGFLELSEILKGFKIELKGGW